MNHKSSYILILCGTVMSLLAALASSSLYFSRSSLEPPLRTDPWLTPSHPPPARDVFGDPGNIAAKSEEYPKLTRTERYAYLAISNAEIFEVPYSGLGGSIPQACRAYCTLMKSAKAIPVFNEISIIATPAGKAYALCALHDLCGIHYPSTFAKVAGDESRSFYFSDGSCCVHHETILSLQDQFKSGFLSEIMKYQCDHQ